MIMGKLPYIYLSMVINIFWHKLARDNPNGISFEPLSMRLWCKQAGLDCADAEARLAPHMLKLGKLYFCRQMLAEDEKWLWLDKLISQNLEKYGFFSAGSFLKQIHNEIPKIRTENDAAALLAFIGYELAKYRGHKFCVADAYMAPLSQYMSEEEFERQTAEKRLESIMETLGERLADMLGEYGEIWPESLLREDFANLDAASLETLRQNYFPQAYARVINGQTEWSLPESIGLPEDFSEKITYVIDVLCKLNRNLGAETLGNALDILYGLDFRREHGVADAAIFLDQCAKAYAGQENVRPEYAYKRLRRRVTTGERTRGKDTNFKDLGIPPGSILRLCKDPSVTCEVADETRLVRHDGEVTPISTLARKLLNAADGVNGFREFSYEGESLTKRRRRLNQASTHANQSGESAGRAVIVCKKTPASDDAADQDDNLARDDRGNLIFGLSGKPLSKRFWNMALRAAKIPNIDTYLQRHNAGESFASIAASSPYTERAMEDLIRGYKVYLKSQHLDFQ